MANSPPTRPSTSGSTRILELDALRALAALNLVLFHFTHVYQVKYGYCGSLGFELPYGKYGVQLFFMLSGFVNAMTLLRKRRASDFLVNRVIRIYPSFWMVIALNVVLFSTAPMALGTAGPSTVAANATALPNLWGIENMEPVTWTLQVELLFYGILLLMYLTGSLERPLRTLLLYLALCLIACPAMDYAATMHPDSRLTHALEFARQLLILDYMPLFAIGILLHEIVMRRGNRGMHGLGVVLSAIVFHSIDQYGHNPAVTVGFIGLLVASAYGKLPVLRMKPFVFISAISYALYLVHNNLGSVLIYQVNQSGLSPLLSMMLAIAAMVAVATAYTYWIERPLTRQLKSVWKMAQARWQARRLASISSDVA